MTRLRSAGVLVPVQHPIEATVDWFIRSITLISTYTAEVRKIRTFPRWELGCKCKIGSPFTSTEVSGEKVEREGMVSTVSILPARLKLCQTCAASLSPGPQLEHGAPGARTRLLMPNVPAVLWQQRQPWLGCVISVVLKITTVRPSLEPAPSSPTTIL